MWLTLFLAAADDQGEASSRQAASALLQERLFRIGKEFRSEAPLPPGWRLTVDARSSVFPQAALGRVSVRLLDDGGLHRGEVIASESDDGGLSLFRASCNEDLHALSQKVGRPLRVWVVAGSGLNDSLIGKGYGLRMYAAALHAAADQGAALAPSACDVGATSLLARDLWIRLAARYPSEGWVVWGGETPETRFGAATSGSDGAAIRIALIGDSHSQALWPRLRTSLEAAGHTIVLQEANPGWSEATYLKEDGYLNAGGIGARIRAARPDLVVFELGGNNQVLDAANYRKNAEALVGLAQNAGASVLWFGPPTSDAARAPDTERRHAATTRLQAGLLTRLGAYWVDSRPLTQTGHRADGVHFDTGGYDRWAQAMEPYVQRAMEAFRRQASTAIQFDPPT
jgi:lysophospholipase L1-like esterase